MGLNQIEIFFQNTNLKKILEGFFFFFRVFDSSTNDSTIAHVTDANLHEKKICARGWLTERAVTGRNDA
jgi:hypothetical protein